MFIRRTLTIRIADYPDPRATLAGFQGVQQRISATCYNNGKPLSALDSMTVIERDGRLLGRVVIVYKAQRAGIPVVLVDPRNTSRTCPSCGHIDKANRPNQATFCCTSCGNAGHADVIAAENIRVRGRAVVSQPHVSEADSSVAPETSPCALAVGN